MLIPNWVVDEVLVGASPTAFRLAVMLARHGKRVSDDGRQQIQWRGQKQSLVRLVGASKTAIMDAQRELEAAGILEMVEPDRPRGCFVLRLLVEKSRQKIGPTSESGEEPTDHAADEYQQEPLVQLLTSMNVTHEEVREGLVRNSVMGPDDWLATFGPIRCAHALLALRAAQERTEIANPAGWMFRVLKSGKLPAIDPLDAVARIFGVDSREYRRLKYGGMDGFLEYRQTLDPEG